MEDINILKHIPLFSGFKTTELMNVSMVAKRVVVPRGELIVREGAKGESFYIIKQGRVRVCKRGRGGKEHVLAYLEAGEYFGEVSLVDHQPRSASVYADTETELLIIKASDFNNLISANKELERKFFKAFSYVLCERLRAANENLTFSQEINQMIREMEKGEK